MNADGDGPRGEAVAGPAPRASEAKRLPVARPLGLASAVAIVVANMIGTGVFTTTGFLLVDLPSPWVVLSAWLLGGIVAGCGALSYGALARHIPESGGEYLFLSRTLHPAAGYVAGWISLLVGFSAPLAAAAFGFGAYLKIWLPGWSPQVTGSMLLVACCGLHFFHTAGGAWIQNVAVLLKVILIVGFIGWAAGQLPAAEPITVPSFSASSFALALVWISFSYSGWNAAVYVAGEIRNPKRNLPAALFLGTAVVTLLYVALNAVFLFAVQPGDLAGKLEVGQIAAQALGGPAWAGALTALIALALVTCVSSMMMAGPRVYARMAADGFLPRWLAKETGPPRVALAFQCLLALAMLWSATYDRLLTFIGFTLSLSTAATILGLIVLRRRESDRFPVPGWPYVPGFFLLAVGWITVVSILRRPAESLVGLATIGLGWLAWKCRRR